MTDHVARRMMSSMMGTAKEKERTSSHLTYHRDAYLERSESTHAEDGLVTNSVSPCRLDGSIDAAHHDMQ